MELQIHAKLTMEAVASIRHAYLLIRVDLYVDVRQDSRHYRGKEKIASSFLPQVSLFADK